MEHKVTSWGLFVPLLLSLIFFPLTTSLTAQSNPVLFAPVVTYGAGGYNSYLVAIADVNGDGNPDLIVANLCSAYNNCVSGAVGVLLGTGDGTFQPAVTYGSGGYAAVSLAVADVNGDGNPDLVVANDCNGFGNCPNVDLGVLLGNGNGTFQTVVPYGSGGAFVNSVAVADVNGDGKPDLLAMNFCGNFNCASNSTVGVLLGNGDGTFQSAVTYGSGGFLGHFVTVARDVNGDGKPDLLVAHDCASADNCVTGSVGVLLGNGDGTFQSAVTYGSGGWGPIG